MAQPLRGSVLIVDDEPVIVRALARLLRRDGYRVETASNGRQALARLQTQSYDVILSDLRMPELDGRAFYDCLVQGYGALYQRVIFFTGDYGTPSSRAFLEQSGQPWVRKPCTITAVRCAIEQVLRGAGPSATAR